MKVGKLALVEINKRFDQWTRTKPDDLVAVLRDLGIWDAEIYTVEHEFGCNGSFPVSFDVAPDIGRVYVEPGDRVVVIREEPE